MEGSEYGIETEMNRGFLQILVLLVLESSMYGYQMARSIQEQGYPLEENTLYPLLRRLEKNGWISSRWDLEKDRPKKYYLITENGREARRQFLHIWELQQRIIKKLEKERMK